MNGKIQVIDAIAVRRHTGKVWGAVFPDPDVVLPDAGFMDDMGWGVSERVSGRNLSWAAYGIRKGTHEGKAVVEVKFVDYGTPATPVDADEKSIRAILRSPIA